MPFLKIQQPRRKWWFLKVQTLDRPQAGAIMLLVGDEMGKNGSHAAPPPLPGRTGWPAVGRNPLSPPASPPAGGTGALPSARASYLNQSAYRLPFPCPPHGKATCVFRPIEQ